MFQPVLEGYRNKDNYAVGEHMNGKPKAVGFYIYDKTSTGQWISLLLPVGVKVEGVLLSVPLSVWPSMSVPSVPLLFM